MGDFWYVKNNNMNIEDLRVLIERVIEECLELKNKYIVEEVGEIDYVGMYPKSESEWKEMVGVVNDLGGKEVFADDDWVVYKLETLVDTKYGEIGMVKLGNFRESEKRIGYVDFRPFEFEKLKQKYMDSDNFVTLSGDGWELIGVEDPGSRVSFYVPDVPLSEDVG